MSKFTTMDSAILMTLIRTMGRETFLPSVSLKNIFFAMKNSFANLSFLALRKYTKVFALESILLLLLTQCSLTNAKAVDPTDYSHSVPTVLVEGEEENELLAPKRLLLGIDRVHLILDSIVDKRIAVVANQTAVVNDVHLVDTLLSLGLDVKKVFAPEHGFRGTADAGEHVESKVDSKTGLPLISLYGSNKKPTKEQLEDVDVVIYDIQDVGVRFYTFISTLHYVMKACAENNKTVYVLDRPNPNGHYVDGPVLQKEFKSFVGMHPVPIVYGMTIGEYALMVNGEGWLEDSSTCDLRVVPCKYYHHKMKYNLPIDPSPNLKTPAAIAFYPSLCLFEATVVSVGRGTERPFEWFGHPKFPNEGVSFTPRSMEGAKNPMYENELCYAIDVEEESKNRLYQLNLTWLKRAAFLLKDEEKFVKNPSFFNRLAGNDQLIQQIQAGWSDKEIRATWKPGLDEFKDIRKKYLIYD